MGATTTSVEAARQRKTEEKVLVHHRHHEHHEHQEEEEEVLETGENLHHIDNDGTPEFPTLVPRPNTAIILR